MVDDNLTALVEIELITNLDTILDNRHNIGYKIISLCCCNKLRNSFSIAIYLLAHSIQSSLDFIDFLMDLVELILKKSIA